MKEINFEQKEITRITLPNYPVSPNQVFTINGKDFVINPHPHWIVNGTSAKADPKNFIIKKRWYDGIAKFFGFDLMPDYEWVGPQN